MTKIKFDDLLGGVLVLSAGFGTRMGKIGSILPKILWPIGNKTLFELQYLYIRQFFQGPIYFNVHYLYQDVLRYLDTHKEKFKNVHILHEPEILEIGGAIHHLATKLMNPYQGKFLVLNCDQFLFMSHQQVLNLINFLETSPVALASIQVPNQGYNSIVIEKGILKGIIINPPKELSTIETYAGVCALDLAKIEPCGGKSKFFQSVARYLDFPVAVEFVDHEKSTYWDFGTKERYVSSLLALWEKQNFLTSPFTHHQMEEILCRQVEGSLQNLNGTHKLVFKNGDLECVVNHDGEAVLKFRNIEDQVGVELISKLRSLMASTGQTSTHK
ncbi:MAG: NTP transferase domain-containing protein [Bacteriovoracaceae bacterium]|nr:NTP transferase domain-containing protein [Bacteriovoracaceae bacterium]